MDVGRLLSGSQLMHKSEQLEVTTTTAGERSRQQTITNTKQSNAIETERRPEVINRAEIESMVEGLNEFLEPINTSIKFELHDRLEKYYVTVVDSATEEIIREIPPKQMLDMYAAMAEYMGLIVDEKI
ncbi:flagellar protein FlaG [Natronobacillus azotifigens]|uniref:Flagellar protein FlaG n=1 Tax=Natronobacillus azotifigens TaxID=472978 RepID=A0A9J6RFD0_9BACI|nr:flagellar protein FlaG [Natronobacillus azotifigens]MCZ0704141.1 flagellar protein FlaG [Natronobacillus azotifigens]